MTSGQLTDTQQGLCDLKHLKSSNYKTLQLNMKPDFNWFM